MAAFKILATIFYGLAIVVSGPILGERLQDCRHDGVERLEFPGRDLPAWPAYLDVNRYRNEGRRYIGWLVVTQFVLPFGLLALFISFL